MHGKIIVATHKEYPMPPDTLYLPVHAGSALHPPLPFQPDCDGDNISVKNPNYCELTCLYWAWKNLKTDYLGLCHYRRYLGCGRSGERWSRILTAEQAEALLANAPVLLPKKRHYWIETNYSQYAHAHHAVDLDATRDILSERWPEYLPFFDTNMKKNCGHRFNMFVMRRELLDQYCFWLFDILFELERHLDLSRYSVYDQRVFGFISERLLDVWLDTNHIPFLECNVVNLERQNWIKKGGSFLKRKFFHQVN